MVLDETKELLAEFIDEVNAPFIYEKVGNRYNRYMIDEFQDTSQVQWTNFSPLLHNSDSQDGESLIVGDVKQSIYRFRMACPDLFMEKYETYSLEEGNYRRIDLHKNFRSRAIVLDSVNRIFQQIYPLPLIVLKLNQQL